jgi:hypothetical protein
MHLLPGHYGCFAEDVPKRKDRGKRLSVVGRQQNTKKILPFIITPKHTITHRGEKHDLSSDCILPGLVSHDILLFIVPGGSGGRPASGVWPPPGLLHR